MDLYYDSSGPRIDTGVAARLRRLDPNLAVTFSRYAIDLLTSVPVEIKNWEDDTAHLIERRGDAHFLLEPAFHLWVRDGSRYRWIGQYPAAVGFGHREVANLEADIARRGLSPTQMLCRMRERDEAKRERAMKNKVELQRDVVKANMKRIQRLCNADDKSPDHSGRDAKAVSYAGQTNRATRGRVRKDNREDGWELPERN